MRFAIGTTALLLLAALNGYATFRADAAVEVSRDELLAMSHNDTTDCLWYKGSDKTYHYIFHNDAFRKTLGSEGSYKIRAEELPLKETFTVGKGGYPLFTPTILEATAKPAEE